MGLLAPGIAHKALRLQGTNSDAFLPLAGTIRSRITEVLLVSCVAYLTALSFVNAQGVRIGSAHVALVEVLIYSVCLGLQLRRIPMITVAVSACVFTWIFTSWLIRQNLDPKSLRDLLIPLLFIGLGMQNGSVKFADRVLTVIVIVVVTVALFETAFLDVYGRIFNPLSFYGNIGGIRESAAMYGGQTLTLNGFRPEGIGRTLLPMVLGAHRTSSTMMEPVSLGNFGVILLAWGLAKPRKEIIQFPIFVLSSALLIILADSRFGLVMGLVLVVARMFPLAQIRRFAPMFPLLILSSVLAISMQTSAVSDNILGRVRQSGATLFHFDALMWFGLRGPLPGFGDMGFAYVISRFGMPMCMLLTFGLFLVPMPDIRGQWFRAFAVLYIFANFAISGTSVFALKTAGILWFLFGVLSATGRAPIAGQLHPIRPAFQKPNASASAHDRSGHVSVPPTDTGRNVAAI